LTYPVAKGTLAHTLGGVCGVCEHIHPAKQVDEAFIASYRGGYWALNPDGSIEHDRYGKPVRVDVPLPEGTKPGDVVVFACTGGRNIKVVQRTPDGTAVLQPPGKRPRLTDELIAVLAAADDVEAAAKELSEKTVATGMTACGCTTPVLEA
jgi:hypothetical protein